MKKLLTLIFAITMVAGLQAQTIQNGDTVMVNPSVTHYATGESISSWVYKVKHTVEQVGSVFHKDGILLSGIRSWLNISDVKKVDEKTTANTQNQVVTEVSISKEEKEEVFIPNQETKEVAPAIEKHEATTSATESTETTLSQNIVLKNTPIEEKKTLHQKKQGPTSLSGRLVSRSDNKAIVGAVITLGNQNISTSTNNNGEFMLSFLEPGDEEIIIEADGYMTNIELVNLVNGEIEDMGTLALDEDIVRDAQEEILLNLAESELSDDEGKTQEQASSASASTDVFNNITSFAWSTARYRNRGYSQTYESNYIMGLNFMSAERGSFNFSAMGGLNDATRYKENVNAIEANNFTFGSVGNNTNYLMNASRYAAGWKVGLAGTNRNYKAAVRATYASGVLSNGWSFIGQLAFRFSPYCQQKGIIGEGIDYYSVGYFFAAEKDWQNGKHKLNLITFGAPTRRGQNSALTQEVVDLTGTTNYNPYWGYQDGKIRNSRIVKSYDPTVIATYEYKPSNEHLLKAAVGAHYSKYSNSAIQFFNAPNPDPSYYRNLPSILWDGQIGYLDSDQMYNLYGSQADGSHYPWGMFIGADMNNNSMGSGTIGADGTILGPSIDKNAYNELVNIWKKRDNTATQIQWDNLYAANYANNANNPDGSARYIVERRHNDIREINGSLNYVNTAYKHLKMTAGLEVRLSEGVHYKSIDDLLGANQWIDVDPFADRDIKELAENIGLTQDEMNYVKQNDLKHPNKAIHTGEKFGYDYRLKSNTERLWFQNEWNFSNLDLYYGVQLTYSSMHRTTNMQNGRAWYLAQMNPDEKDLYLNSNMHHFFDPAIKAGLNYKVDGRNHIKLNAMARTESPLARVAYISPRVHDRVIESIYVHDNAKSMKEFFGSSEKSVSADLTYEFNYPIVRGRVTGFFSQFWNGTELNGYYDDEANTFVSQVLTGMDRRHMGIEAALSVKLGTYFTLTGAASVGDYRYTNNGLAVTTAENGMALGEDVNGNAVFSTRDSVFMRGVRVSNGPQVNSSLKLSFFHPKMWFADITVSYYDWNYLSVAPSRRSKGLFTGVREDGTKVDGWFGDTNANAMKTTDGEALSLDVNASGLPVNAEVDKNGMPVLRYPYNIMTMQESLSATNPLNRFLVDVSVGKLLYLKNRQSLSINLSVTNLTNNNHFKTGGYQQARLPRQTRQGQPDNNNSVISPNAWKFPSRYYYAWGTNFYLSLTYKF